MLFVRKFDPLIHHRRSLRLRGYDYSRAGRYFITICCQGHVCRFGIVENGKMILNDAGKMIEKWHLKLPEKFRNIELGPFVVMPNHFHAIIIIVPPPIVRADLRVRPDVWADLCVRPNDSHFQNVRPDNTNSQIVCPDYIDPEIVGPDNIDPEIVRPDNIDQRIVGPDDINPSFSGGHVGPPLPSDGIDSINPGGHDSNDSGGYDYIDLGGHDSNELGVHVGPPQQCPPQPDGSPQPDRPTIPHIVQWFKTMTTNEYIRGVKNLGWERFDGKLWQRNYYEHIIRDEKSYIAISEYIKNNPAKWIDDTFYHH